LHRRGLKFFFRPAAHDEMFSLAMFEFMDALKKGKKIDSVGLSEDTIFGTTLPTSSASSRPIAATRSLPTSVSRFIAVADCRSTADQERQPRRAIAVELHHRHHFADEDHGRAWFTANNIHGQAAGFSDNNVRCGG
jgi:branched-chain amino acid transport system substrate-binding protein